ncbi:uncharacterized protein SCHCODRAFT_02696800 [Schizophyllum commune H4-8]|uniref:uncharacterized protein n=1 Tax=Schizophyllum commune (strain H4-8 / FGSC 9210) TaxID=578458 RepID=UPI00215DE026|nr:uncharacterized protein SCHCODRAFT_02696800 [Schizophyllum commune H4-8]KAI5898216.1 hypothetical protein SCHCODRAFT_02696800 [Schizophyllum commune H4-8]
MLEVDTEAMTVDLEEEWLPWNKTVSTLQGNHQILENGNPIIGWGHQSCFQEYDSNVDLFGPLGSVSEMCNTTAHTDSNGLGVLGPPPPIPSRSPDSVNDTVYASWNGTTEAKQWRLLVSTFDAPPISRRPSPTRVGNTTTSR